MNKFSNSIDNKANKKIGLEVEVPFSFYYPDISEKYLKSTPHGTYGKLPRETKKLFDAEVSAREPELHQKIREASERLGLGK